MVCMFKLWMERATHCVKLHSLHTTCPKLHQLKPLTCFKKPRFRFSTVLTRNAVFSFDLVTVTAQCLVQDVVPMYFSKSIFVICFVFVGMRVFVHGCAATPLTLLDALAKHGIDAKLKDVELIHIHTEGPGIYVQPEYDGNVCCIIFRERTIIGSVSYRNRYWVYRIESYRLLLYRRILRASLQVHQLLTDRITHDDQRAFKRPVTHPPRTHACVLFYGP